MIRASGNMVRAAPANRSRKGVLAGVRVIEFAGIGPGPFCAMMLADHGAEVIRILRPGMVDEDTDILCRSRRMMSIDLKDDEGLEVARRLCDRADILVEGFRPGVMERLGLGPDELLARNPRLVYGRMTGWGQDGPYAHLAGHDINYIALNGVLHSCGIDGDRPVVPVNYIADFGGGGMYLAFGLCAALVHARGSGIGQIVDAAMVDGATLLSSMTRRFFNRGDWEDRPGVNRLDGGAPYYRVYRCSDGKWVSIGAIEPQYYSRLCDLLGFADDQVFQRQDDRDAWPEQARRIAAVIGSRTRDEWTALMSGQDACFAPVLSLAEAPEHPHNTARATFSRIAGHLQPAPGPRFSATPAAEPKPVASVSEGPKILKEIGYSRDEVRALCSRGAVA